MSKYTEELKKQIVRAAIVAMPVIWDLVPSQTHLYYTLLLSVRH